VAVIMSENSVFSAFTIEDLGIAYRKAKVDLYYSTDSQPTAIAEYEDHLEANLRDLLARINSTDKEWVKSDKFLGDWTLVPKAIVPCDAELVVKNGTLFSSPADQWKSVGESNPDKKATAEFRIMAQASMDFHVLSTLWVLQVGHQYDKELSDCAHGNRLRRSHDGGINSLALGTFSPYLKPFRDWRDNGIKAMRVALTAEKRIIALTADISSFYHELNPEFLLDERFNSLFDLDLSFKRRKLHRLFVSALQAWAEKTPLRSGLPVGLPASAVVANVALIELDRFVEKQVVPLYYGRYVDDLILVMENGANIRSVGELW